MSRLLPSHRLVAVFALFWALAIGFRPAEAYELSTATEAWNRFSDELTLRGDWVPNGIIVECTQPPADGGWNVRFQFTGRSFGLTGAFSTFDTKDANGSYTTAEYGVAEVITAGHERVARVPLVVDADWDEDFSDWILADDLPYGYHDVMLYNVQNIRNVNMDIIIPAPPEYVGLSDRERWWSTDVQHWSQRCFWR